MSDIVIVGAKRTAIGSFLGQFSGVPTPTLGAIAIQAALQQSGVPGDDVSEVFMGCVLPANLGQAPARQAAIGAGLPMSAGCTTVNKVCGSGMKAVMLGHDLIKAGSASVVVAGGMESMTNAPHMVQARAGIRYGEGKLVDHMAWDGLTNPYDGKAMGVFGESCADKYHFSREDQDAFAIESVRRARAAQEAGAFEGEIVPVTVKGRKGEVEHATDEQPGRSNIDKIPSLRPAFRKRQRHHHRRQFLEHFRRRGRDGADARRGRRQARRHAAGAHRRPRHPFAGAGVVHHRPGGRHRQGAGQGRLGRRQTWICSRSTRPSRWSPWRP